MTTYVLTCDGCGGTNLRDVRDESDFVIKVDGARRIIPIPLPSLCLDCGSASHSLKRTDA